MGIELSSDPGALRFERPTKIWEQLGNKTPGSEVVFWVPTPTKAIESSSIWRKRVGVEPTIRPAKDRIAGFEDREGHRTPFASTTVRSSHYKV
jgi:hypothetical protein